MAKSVSIISSESQLATDSLKTIIEGSKEPLVLKGQLDSWLQATSWKATELCRTLGTSPTTFKLFPKRGTQEYRDITNGATHAVFETDCFYVEGSFADFKAWLESDVENIGSPATKKARAEETGESRSGGSSPSSSHLSSISRTDYWVYADYKYMKYDIFFKLADAVDWGVLGFKGRGVKDSVLWIGSEGACTPCHYDTFGYNIVAQLSGEKKWTLFCPKDTRNMYPTRIPFEESSVFSEVDVVEPDLTRYPLFGNTTPYEVVLVSGDVLVVPKHWWHYVETVSKEPSVSVNTWMEVASDSKDKVKEALVRTLVTAFSESEETAQDWLNPNEQLLSMEENVYFLSEAVKKHRRKSDGGGAQKEEDVPQMESEEVEEEMEEVNFGVRDLVKVLTDSDIVEIVTRRLCGTGT